MPITFSCPYCSHTIKAPSKLANQERACPKCQETLTIPSKQTAKRTPAPPKAPSTPPPETSGNSKSNVDETRIVDFEALSTAGPDTNHSPRKAVSIRIDPNSCSIPRSVLFLQGGLLAVLALLTFSLGLFVGRLGSSSQESIPAEAKEVTISGKVEYATKAGITTSDDRCVVFLVPALKYPNTKISIAGLGPNDPPPEQTNPSIQQIQELGGSFAKTDTHGNFELKLLKDQEKKRFYLLAVAGYSIRKRDIPATDRAQMGNYFAPGFSDALLRDNDPKQKREYIWKKLSVVGNDTENIEFH